MINSINSGLLTYTDTTANIINVHCEQFTDKIVLRYLQKVRIDISYR